MKNLWTPTRVMQLFVVFGLGAGAAAVLAGAPPRRAAHFCSETCAPQRRVPPASRPLRPAACRDANGAVARSLTSRWARATPCHSALRGARQMTIRLPTLAPVALAFVFPVSADALGANVVPNAGFEQGGCGGNTPVICGWEMMSSGTVMSQDTGDPHSGSASMFLSCDGCGAIQASSNQASRRSVQTVSLGSLATASSDPFPWDDVQVASTDPSVACASIGPGVHPASVWYREEAQDMVGLGGRFYQTPDCSGTESDDSFGVRPAVYGGWEQLTGALVAPPGTESGLFRVGVAVAADFDDVDVEDSVASIPVLSSFTGAGQEGSSVDILGANLTGATAVTIAGVPASFTVDSDTEIHATVPCVAASSSGPIRVTTPSGTATTSEDFYRSYPIITSFSPASGPPGTNVTISGFNLCAVSTVSFNKAAASFTADSDTEIHATVPTGASTGYLWVATPGGPIGTYTSNSPFTVTADATPPDTAITSGPPSMTSSSSATFEFTATEPATFQCSLDAGAFVACGSAATYIGLDAGPHTFRVRATDTAGHTDPTPAQQTWTVTSNAPPTARYTFSCGGLRCHFDGTRSSDPDGTIASYAWDFGDGTSAGSATADHTYVSAAGYVATLTVTDDAGATATQSMMVTPISLSARGYKVRTLERVDLSWNGPAGGFDIYRNAITLATVQANAYTDKLNKTGSGAYTYKVCAAAVSVCSDPVTVTFSSGAAIPRATRPAPRRSRSPRPQAPHANPDHTQGEETMMRNNLPVRGLRRSGAGRVVRAGGAGPHPTRETHRLGGAEGAPFGESRRRGSERSHYRIHVLAGFELACAWATKRNFTTTGVLASG
jgi:hypothetical protein